ncbi:MAG: hypothetical protein ACYC99_04700 [Candidatus Geothermincolia bacterium]
MKSADKACKVAVALLLVALMVAGVAGTALAGDITVPGTEIEIPVPVLPDVQLPEILPTENPVETLPVVEDVLPVVEEVTDTVVPVVEEILDPSQLPVDLPTDAPANVPAQGPAVPQLPMTPAQVMETLMTMPETISTSISSVPIPDMTGKIPALPVPSLTQVTNAVGELVQSILNLLTGNVTAPELPSLGLIVTEIVKRLPTELTNIPLVRSLLDLLLSLLNPKQVVPTPAKTGTTNTTATTTTFSSPPAVSQTYPAATPTALAAVDEPTSSSGSFDHLPYTGTDVMVWVFSILGIATGLILVRKFETWLIARG